MVSEHVLKSNDYVHDDVHNNVEQNKRNNNDDDIAVHNRIIGSHTMQCMHWHFRCVKLRITTVPTKIHNNAQQTDGVVHEDDLGMTTAVVCLLACLSLRTIGSLGDISKLGSHDDGKEKEKRQKENVGGCAVLLLMLMMISNAGGRQSNEC